MRDVHVFAALVALFVVAGALYALWWFIPPPGGIEEARARALTTQLLPAAQVGETYLGHCDHVSVKLFGAPACGGDWVWVVTVKNACHAHVQTSGLVIDYRSGEIRGRGQCGLA